MHVSRGNTFQLEYTKKQNQNQKVNPFIHPDSRAPPSVTNPNDSIDGDGPRGVRRITRRKPVEPVRADRPKDPDGSAAEQSRGRQPDRSRSDTYIKMRSPSPNPFRGSTSQDFNQSEPLNFDKPPSVGAPPTRLATTKSLPEGLNKHFYHFGGDACAVSKQAPPKTGFQIDADWLALSANQITA